MENESLKCPVILDGFLVVEQFVLTLIIWTNMERYPSVLLSKFLVAIVSLVSALFRIFSQFIIWKWDTWYTQYHGATGHVITLHYFLQSWPATSQQTENDQVNLSSEWPYVKAGSNKTRKEIRTSLNSTLPVAVIYFSVISVLQLAQNPVWS